MIDLAVPVDTSSLLNFSQYVQNAGKETFRYIFFDNFDYISKLHNSGKMRDVTFDNIQKTILCSSIYLGYDLYECPYCGQETIVAHTCSSRFCSKCGSKASQRRAAFVSAMAFESKHRHIVFTIPKELRWFFLRDRTLLDGFFVVARNVLACVFNDRKYRKEKSRHKNDLMYKHPKHKSKYLYKDTKDNIVFGAVASLHTFGHSLQWNPHLHVLVCEDGYDKKNNKIKSFAYMSYKKLRQTWRYQLLEYLDERIGDNETFKRLKLWFYTKYTEGFYIHAPRSKKDQDEEDINECVKYITRYTSRPVMAESRIVKYDDVNRTVHWYYHRHEDEKRIDVTEPVETFINNVVLHCPNENFKMVRYFGFYSNKSSKTYDKMAVLVGKKVRRRTQLKKERKAAAKIKQNKTHFRYNMIKSFQRDPLLCKCGEIMEYVETYDPFEGDIKNDRQYRNKCIYESKYLRKRKKPPDNGVYGRRA
ncbi:MAG: transposase [Erysipelotrichales bacterium]|nr:transposase [Erysipelotrichales bacterium]